MTTLLAVLLALQDPSAFTGRLEVERQERRSDRAARMAGTLVVRPGETLQFRSESTRVELLDDRLQDGWLFVLDLWKRTDLDRLFETLDDFGSPLPPGIAGASPVAAKLGPGARVEGSGESGQDGCRRVLLVPRDADVKARVSSIRLSVDRATGRILRAVAQTPDEIVTCTLTGVEPR